MWNNTDIPLAYLITFRCYGTWLHGDERGAIDRFNNRYKSPYIPQNKEWKNYNQAQLKSPPFELGAKEREVVESAIRETCDIRKWLLEAINVRTNHAHTVVSISTTKSHIALNAFKSNATKKLRENGLWEFGYSPWADKGSHRHLWTERSVALAIEYVLYGQGNELPDFD